jgi:hypothetical protein
MTRDAICKNCAYFYYEEWSKTGHGYCYIELPPWVDVSREYRLVYSNAKCDLHKPKETEAET